MASGAAMGWLRQKKHYAKYFAFLAVSVFLYLGYMLAIHFDVVSILPVLSGENGTTWQTRFVELAKEASSPSEGNATERSSPDGSSSKTVSYKLATSPDPGDSRSDGPINSTVGALKKRWLITLDEQLGRFGNMMFEYASVIGIGWMTERHPFVQHCPDIEKIFKLTHVENMSTDETWSLVEETQYAYFDPVFKKLPAGNIKITGFLQSWKYFDRIRGHVREEFTLLQSVRNEVDKLKDEISLTLNKTNPVFVGVHVRQKDELSNSMTLEAPRSYFINAFSKMRSLLSGFDLVFIVAGNRVDWCLANLNDSDVYVLPLMSPEMHFAALSSCDHAILSVGSYGWWMAWLTGGQVVFYKKFPTPESFEYSGFVYDDYYPPSWIPVDD